ncbi:MAG: PQQ-binding-like beta-propeller repeat protein [Acidimicrobiales bacterium]
MSRRLLTGVVAVMVLAGPFVVLRPMVGATPPSHRVLLGAEDNRLRAYDPVTGAQQVVLPSKADDSVNGLDSNAQICEDPQNPGYFIDGEDTGQPNPPQGWGYFQLLGTAVGNLSAVQLGKLTPTYQSSLDNAENYGCGFLPNGDLLTTDVGNQQPTDAADGQLIVWFRPPSGKFDSNSVAYCKVDVTIPTAGGIWVEGSTVFAAANRPDLQGGQLGGIYRYEGSWPTGPTGADGCGRTDGTGAPLVSEGRITKTLFITADPVGALTPSAIVGAPGGHYYVSSVLTGVIAEYDAAGQFVRRILQPAVTDLQPPYATGTPFGMAVGDDGSLYYADIGVELTLPAPGPGDHNGSQRVIHFVDGQPQAPVTMATGLQYPDGQGFVTITESPGAPVTSPNSSSEWGCGNWGMYGASLGRTFSTTCASSIAPLTTPTMVPAWTVPMPRTVTASPVVVGGTVYVGDWSGTMYALSLNDGSQRWSHQTDGAPGAAFGPIVSSAAITDVVIGGVTKRLVIFGAGPKLYALDAATGAQVWKIDRSAGLVDTPVEIESSPVVWKGVVYVGIDTHNHPATETNGVRGGLMAVDAATGAQVFTFEPELGQPGSGCGSVWSSPTIDTANSRVLLATGNCEADAANFTWNAHTEAVTAVDATTGAVAWTFQPHAPNRADLDFGATPNVITLGNGQRLIGIGNKDAVYYALNPASGALVWSKQVALPGNIQEDFAVGGFIGSTATWQGNVYGGTALGGPLWYHSLNGATGAKRWSAVAGPTYAGSAVVNGVVFAGDLTGTLKAFSAANGLPLGIWPLLGPISSSPAVAGSTVVIGSGTSSSDLCAKGTAISDACFQVFDLTLGSLGAVTALKPLALL